jgi:hypothetical protein
MNSFDDQLKKALERKQPSTDFTARVLAAASSERRRTAAAREHGGWRWWRPVWLAPLAAMLAVTLGVVYQQHHVRVEGELAKEKLVIALRVTGVKLQEAQAKVVGISEERRSDK